MILKTRRAAKVIDWLIVGTMLLLGIIWLLPFAWLFSMSFRPVSESYRMPPSFLPPNLDFKNYESVLTSVIPFLKIYWNSTVIAVLVTLGQLCTCSFAAFAFSRLRFPGRDSLFFVVLLGLMFPAQVTIIPIYFGFAKLGLINNIYAVVLMTCTSSFGIFLIRQFMLSQPKALEEAALMDGAGPFKIFWRISLPQLYPALSALGIITFTQTWNSYLPSRILLESQQTMTLPVAMDLLRGYLASGNLSEVMAAMSMAVLPILVLFLLAQKFVIQGITMTGIRG